MADNDPKTINWPAYYRHKASTGQKPNAIPDTVEEFLHDIEIVAKFDQIIKISKIYIVEDYYTSYPNLITVSIPGITEFNEAIDQLTSTVDDDAERNNAALERFADAIFTLSTDVAELAVLAPFIRKTIKQLKLQEKTLSQLTEEHNNSSQTLWAEILAAARQAKAIDDAIPKLKSTGTPDKYISPNTRLANALQGYDGCGELIGAGIVSLPVMNTGKSNPVTNIVTASLVNTDNMQITGKPFSEYDRAVFDSAITIIIDRRAKGLPKLATEDMLYGVMTGKSGDDKKASKQQKAAIMQSLDKMSTNIRVTIDASEELAKRNVTTPDGKPITRYTKSGFLLAADKIEVEAGGKTVTCYLFHDNQILLEHAELTGQLITVDSKRLDIKAIDAHTGLPTTVSIANTDTRIATKMYLLRRIETMRHDEMIAADNLRQYNSRRKKNSSLPVKEISDFRKQQHTILFSTIFNHAGAESADKQTDIRKYVFQVLDYWQAIGKLSSYIKRKGTGTSRAIDAVIINL